MVETPLGCLRLARSTPPGELTLTIRPEAVRLEGGENSFPARVTEVSYLGTRVTCNLDAAGVKLRVALPPHERPREGAEVTTRLPAGSLWVLDESP